MIVEQLPTRRTKMSHVMVELLKSKIDRNEERIGYWEWCKEFVRNNPGQFRLRYNGTRFQLEEKCDTLAGVSWVQGCICDFEK